MNVAREEARVIVARFFQSLSLGYGLAAAIERAGNGSPVDADVTLNGVSSVKVRFKGNDTVEVDSNGSI